MGYQGRKLYYRERLSHLAVLPYVIAGITLLVAGANGLYWLVAAVIFSFIKAILDAWVLLVEINR